MPLIKSGVIHAISAPIIFAVVSSYYFKKYDFTTPLETAILFVAFVVLMDFFVVALLINRSLGMFGNVLGTWIPFVLIFAFGTKPNFKKLRKKK